MPRLLVWLKDFICCVCLSLSLKNSTSPSCASVAVMPTMIRITLLLSPGFDWHCQISYSGRQEVFLNSSILRTVLLGWLSFKDFETATGSDKIILNMNDMQSINARPMRFGTNSLL